MEAERRLHRAHPDDGGCGPRPRLVAAAARRSVVHPVTHPRCRGPDSVTMTKTTQITTLLNLIRDKQARVGVIGLGYVGLPLAVEFARAGFSVTGFDVDPSK